MLSVSDQCHVLVNLTKATIDRQPQPSSELLAQALPLAKKNDIYFYVLSLLDSRAGEPEMASTAHAECLRLYARQRHVEQEMARLSQFFFERGLPVFFIKDIMRYPFTDHDVDFVAADKGSVTGYRMSMKEAGYRYRFGKSQIREPDKYFYYPLHSVNGFADIRFHLHKALSWNAVVFLDSESVLSRCREEKRAGGPFLVPGYEDEVLIMAAHAVFENASIRMGEILQFGLIVRDEKIDWQYVVDAATQYNWQAGLAFFLEAVWATLSETCTVSVVDHMHEWAMSTLSDAGVGDAFPLEGLAFPYEIPYTICMRLYLDKMCRDIRGRCLSPKAFFWEGLSFLAFVWLCRLKKRLV